MDEVWLYLAVVLDLFNREIVGWSVTPRMTGDIVLDALIMAWFRRNPRTVFDLPFGSGQPIREPRVPDQAHRIRHDEFDELQGKLLGQRAGGGFLQEPEERAGA